MVFSVKYLSKRFCYLAFFNWQKLELTTYVIYFYWASRILAGARRRKDDQEKKEYDGSCKLRHFLVLAQSQDAIKALAMVLSVMNTQLAKLLQL